MIVLPGIILYPLEVFFNKFNFTKQFYYPREWIQELQKSGYIVKQSSSADLDTLAQDCQDFIKECSTKYNNPIVGVFGLCSGGYYALRLKKIFSRLGDLSCAWQLAAARAPIIMHIITRPLDLEVF